jgi:hypothetical protein
LRPGALHSEHLSQLDLFDRLAAPDFALLLDLSRLPEWHVDSGFHRPLRPTVLRRYRE